jgi:hypothetical protein
LTDAAREYREEARETLGQYSETSPADRDR